MAPSRLTRLGGLGALLGGTLWLIALALVQLISRDLTWVIAVPIPLLALGFVAVQMRQSGKAGRVGVLAFAVALVGALMLAFGSAGRLVLTGEIAGVAFGPLVLHGVAPGAVVFGAGAALVAVTTIVADVLPRLSPLPLLAGAVGVAVAGGMSLWAQFQQGATADTLPLELAPLLGLWALFGAGWLWLGYLLWAERMPDAAWR